MKKLLIGYLCLLLLVLGIAGCNKEKSTSVEEEQPSTAYSSVPKQSIFDPLTEEEVDLITKSLPDFETFYNSHNFSILEFYLSQNDINKYKDITYRRYYTYYRHYNDHYNGNEYWDSLLQEWEIEWNNTFKNNLDTVDEVAAYWSNYKEEHALSRYAKIELSDIKVSYYDYINELKDAYICFKIKPLQGTIEQIKFKYSYDYKINEGKTKNYHHCIYSTPISKTTEGMWEVDFLERDRFENMTLKRFLQTYDVDIEITNIRIDGKNYTTDLDIPDAIIDFWEEDNPSTRAAIALLINPSFIDKDTYLYNKIKEKMAEFDSLCYSFEQQILQEENLLYNFYSY